MTTVAAILLLSYLVGGIPWSWLAVRAARGIDLRQVGSGNLGATNTVRALGVPAALVVLVLDAVKGWVAPALFAQLRIDPPAVDASALPSLAGGAAIAGHIFSPYMRFKGGKGIATTAGVFAALEPRALGIACAAFAIGALATRGIVSVGSLLAALALPFATWALQAPGDKANAKVLLAVAVAVIVWLKHAPNLGRLLRHEEKPLFARRAAP
jgi:glycerol-3-phosphate acyltransferase PlsY